LFHDRVREGHKDMTLADQNWVRVGKVPFGKGVFARQDIPKGTIVGYVTGRVIDDPNYGTSYCIDIGGSMSLEPHAPFRYLNHCCTPNSQLCVQDVIYADGTPAPAEVSIEAISEISKGSELTIDYKWSAVGAIKCLCGSSKCRGWIVAEEELAKLPNSKKRNTKQVC